MSIVDKIKTNLRVVGFDIVVLKNAIRGFGFYIKDLRAFSKQRGNDKSFPIMRKRPYLGDRFEKAGVMSGHYFHQDLLIAKKIYENRPLKHIDIGSRIDGFVAHVAVFRKIEVIDVREQVSKIENIVFRRADLMKLPEDLINACESISSLHAIEHFGLGRYGDPVDYFGHLKAIKNIAMMLKPNGKFYFSVPIGLQRLEFNAQRVFSVRYLLDILEKDFNVDSLSYVDDKGDLYESVELKEIDIDKNFGCYFGCGIFELTKK